MRQEVDKAFVESCVRSFRLRRTNERSAHAERAEKLREHAREAARRIVTELGAERVWLFGSLAWGSAHGSSDVDLFVEGLTPPMWLDAHAIAEETVGGSVDVVLAQGAPPELSERVRSEGVLLHEAS